MRIKWNWGTKLFIATALFMIMLSIFFYMTTLQDNPLVEDEYYQLSLEYQKKLDKTASAKNLEEKIKIDLGQKYLTITFQTFFNPDSVEGTIQIYRPSNPDFDINISINPDTTGRISIPIEKLHTGKYIVKIDYKYGDTEYYQEDGIYIN